MTVTQRSREIALLRAIGARRRQVLGSLLLEAVVLGTVASAIGMGLGVGVAKGLKALMDAVGLALPFTSLQIPAVAVWASVLVGTGVTVVSALVPARRATKVLPVEALREATPGAERPSWRRALVGLFVLGAGAAGMLSSLYGDTGMSVFGLGLLAAMLGVITCPQTAAPSPKSSRKLRSPHALEEVTLRPMQDCARQSAMPKP